MAQQERASQKPFRVVIVGAGLVGLSLSHALQLANIDHVVLEKHSKIVSLHGAALVRPFDKLPRWKALNSCS
jgi:FAD dependent monooxygenase